MPLTGFSLLVLTLLSHKSKKLRIFFPLSLASSIFPEFKEISRPATYPAKGQCALNDIHFSHRDVNQHHTNIEYEPGLGPGTLAALSQG